MNKVLVSRFVTSPVPAVKVAAIMMKRGLVAKFVFELDQSTGGRERIPAIENNLLTSVCQEARVAVIFRSVGIHRGDSIADHSTRCRH
jgi:hypothetical protein